MRRDRKNSMKKERVIMLASSAFVLAALTMTGIYMKSTNEEVKDDGYTLDFAALEESADDKFQEIALQDQNNTTQIADNSVRNQTGNTTFGNTGVQSEVTEDDLDYMPLEVGSGTIEIPGLTDKAVEEKAASEEESLKKDELVQEKAENIEDKLAAEDEIADVTAGARGEVPLENEPAVTENIVVEQVLSFTETDTLLRPVAGEVLMNYSMSESVYFKTLDQYKYNPAMLFNAVPGEDVLACADARVADIYTDAELGNVIVLDLGDGYLATYGQLQEVGVNKEDMINAGDKIAAASTPTIYYSLEGNNVYFQLTKDGEPVNPGKFF